MKYKWLTKPSKIFLKNGYLTEGETPESRIEDIAFAAQKILNKKDFAERFLECMEKGWFLLSTPVWANFGRDRGLPISCFNSYIEDRMDSILYNVAEVGMMTKMGGGCSGFFGNLRPRGSAISAGGKSEGVVNFMRLFDTTMLTCKQAAVRRGVMGCYLPIDHGDLDEFLKVKQEGSPIQELFTGVCVEDQWMREMIDGDRPKREIWAKVLKSRSEVGIPYIFFSDNVNNNAPQVYKDKDRKVHGSNVCCVTADQRVPSQFGLLTVGELFEKSEPLILTDGRGNTVNSSPMKLLGENQRVLKITLSNGLSHTVTEYHRIPKRSGRTEDIVFATNLKIGDFLRVQENKGVFGKNDMRREAFLLGIYQADGTQNKDMIYFDVWENDFDLLGEIQDSHNFVCDKYNTQISEYNGRKYDYPKFAKCEVQEGSPRKKRLGGKACKKALQFEKGYVPNWIWEGTEETQWQYIRGLFYADGSASESARPQGGTCLYLSLANINEEFLKEIQILLSNLGCRFALSNMREGGLTSLPDGKGGNKEYLTKDCYRLVCGNKNSAILFEKWTGFLSRKGVELKDSYRDNSKKYFEIVKIEDAGFQDVYCVEVESEDHLWVCNGLVTHNSEIMLSSSEDESFVCCLSSMNLLHYEEWKDTDAVEIMAYFLDAVLTEFIEKASKIDFMGRAVKFAENQRAIGIGATGWHSFLQNKMIAFESLEAKMWNVEIFENMNKKSLEASKKAAKELGEPPMLKGYGERWVTRHAIAPNTSSAFVLGQVSQSIEPFHSNYYVKDLAKFNATIKNPYLEKLLIEKEKNTDEVWDSILLKNGSVQHLDFLSQDEKDVFRTFTEISPRETVIQAAQRQKFIDQGQSLNLMIPPDTKTKDINDLLIFAWENGIKTLYYQKSINAAQAFYRKLNECSSCEG